jgi:hypothetical protein
MARKNYKHEFEARLSDLRAGRADIDARLDAKSRRAMGSDFGEQARKALSISESDSSIKAAFERSGLDHRNPFHWKIVLETLANVVFGSPGRGGRRRTWTIKRYWQLLADLDDLKEERPGAKITELCNRLAKRPEYADLSPESLRRRLHEAAALIPNFQRCIPVAERRGSGETQTFSFLPEEAFEPFVREILSSIGERKRGS